MARPVTDHERERLLEAVTHHCSREALDILIRTFNELRELRDTRAERLYSAELETDWGDG